MEGLVYDSIEDEQAKVESYLRELARCRPRAGKAIVRMGVDARSARATAATQCEGQPDDNRYNYSGLGISSCATWISAGLYQSLNTMLTFVQLAVLTYGAKPL